MTTMNPTLVVEYATEGAPFLLADAASAVRWRGRSDDGSGVVVEYMGQKVETLPKDLLQTAKPGRQLRKFGSLQEAQAFEGKLLDALKELHPEAARHPRFPNQPAYYLGTTRVYSVEVKFTSMFDTVLKQLKSDVQVVVIDKKSKAQAVFMQQGGGGRGLVLADSQGGTLIVAKLHHGAPADRDAAVRKLAALDTPRTKAKISLDGRVFAFDSASSADEIADATWHQPSLEAAVGPAFDGRDGGPLRVKGQQAPGGAFCRLPAGEYSLSYSDDTDVAGGASVLWLVKR